MSLDLERSEEYTQPPLVPLVDALKYSRGRYLELTEDEKRIRQNFEQEIEAKYLGIRSVFDQFLYVGAPPDIYREFTEDRIEFPIEAAILQPVHDEYQGKPYTWYKVIAKSTNTTNLHNQSDEHAEIVVLRRAAEIVGDKHLPEDFVLVSSVEPCSGCAKNTVNYKCNTIIYGVHHDKLRGTGTFVNNQLKPWAVEPEGYSAEEFIRARNPKALVIGGYREQDILNHLRPVPLPLVPK